LAEGARWRAFVDDKADAFPPRKYRQLYPNEPRAGRRILRGRVEDGAALTVIHRTPWAAARASAAVVRGLVERRGKVDLAGARCRRLGLFRRSGTGSRSQILVNGAVVGNLVPTGHAPTEAAGSATDAWLPLHVAKRPVRVTIWFAARTTVPAACRVAVTIEPAAPRIGPARSGGSHEPLVGFCTANRRFGAAARQRLVCSSAASRSSLPHLADYIEDVAGMRRLTSSGPPSLSV